MMYQLTKPAILVLAAITCGSALSETSPEDAEQLAVQAKAKSTAFAKMLKQALMTAVQSGGFENGVKVCKDQAPEIAAQLSTDGWDVARTSLKTRNSKNAADSWEYDMLVAFDREFKAGKPANSLTATALRDNQFCYMQAILTGQLCLACHGQNIEPGLGESIKQAYPKDLATGFTLNDIRGAFTVTKSLNE